MAIENIKYAEPPQLPEVALPSQLEEAWSIKQRYGVQASYIAGGTLLRTQWENRQRAAPFMLISLAKLQELRGIVECDGAIRIGSAVTLQACLGSILVEKYASLIGQAIRSIAAPSVRNVGTLGGNVSSLTGDSVPAMLALDAELLLFRRGTYDRVPLCRWIAKPEERHVDEIVCSIYVPAIKEETYTASQTSLCLQRYIKLGRRAAFTPSLVTLAISLELTKDSVIRKARIAAGGASAMPARLRHAETLLSGALLSDLPLSHLMEAIMDEYAPVSDVYAGDSYRKQAAANLVAAELWTWQRRCRDAAQ